MIPFYSVVKKKERVENGNILYPLLFAWEINQGRQCQSSSSLGMFRRKSTGW